MGSSSQLWSARVWQVNDHVSPTLLDASLIGSHRSNSFWLFCEETFRPPGSSLHANGWSRTFEITDLIVEFFSA